MSFLYGLEAGAFQKEVQALLEDRRGTWTRTSPTVRAGPRWRRSFRALGVRGWQPPIRSGEASFVRACSEPAAGNDPAGSRAELLWLQSLWETSGGGTSDVMRGVVARQALGLGGRT